MSTGSGGITDLPEADPAYLDALYRGRGRMECRIRDAKDTGLTNLPSHSFAINTAWLTLVLIAADLLAWTKTLCLDGELATAEPKRRCATPRSKPGCSSAQRGAPHCAAPPAGHGPPTWSPHSPDSPDGPRHPAETPTTTAAPATTTPPLV